MCTACGPFGPWVQAGSRRDFPGSLKGRPQHRSLRACRRHEHTRQLPPHDRADPASCSFPPAVPRREVPSLSAEHRKAQQGQSGSGPGDPGGSRDRRLIVRGRTRNYPQPPVMVKIAAYYPLVLIIQTDWSTCALIRGDKPCGAARGTDQMRAKRSPAPAGPRVSQECQGLVICAHTRIQPGPSPRWHGLTSVSGLSDRSRVTGEYDRSIKRSQLPNRPGTVPVMRVVDHPQLRSGMRRTTRRDWHGRP